VPKKSWNAFIDKHGSNSYVCAGNYPYLNKTVIFSNGKTMSPTRALAQALNEVIRGDWALKTETITGFQVDARGKKKRAPSQTGIVILLSEENDIAAVRTTIGAGSFSGVEPGNEIARKGKFRFVLENRKVGEIMKSLNKKAK
jgi:hypothetical protein